MSCFHHIHSRTRCSNKPVGKRLSKITSRVRCEPSWSSDPLPSVMENRMTLHRGGLNLLVGTWRLVSVNVELSDTGETMDMYGPKPLDYLIVTVEGRLVVIETVRDRQQPQSDVDNAVLFKSM